MKLPSILAFMKINERIIVSPTYSNMRFRDERPSQFFSDTRTLPTISLLPVPPRPFDYLLRVYNPAYSNEKKRRSASPFVHSDRCNRSIENNAFDRYIAEYEASASRNAQRFNRGSVLIERISRRETRAKQSPAHFRCFTAITETILVIVNYKSRPK